MSWLSREPESSANLRNILRFGAFAAMVAGIAIGWTTGFFAAVPGFITGLWAYATTWVSNLELGQILVIAGPAFFLLLLMLFLLDR